MVALRALPPGRLFTVGQTEPRVVAHQPKTAKFIDSLKEYVGFLLADMFNGFRGMDGASPIRQPKEFVDGPLTALDPRTGVPYRVFYGEDVGADVPEEREFDSKVVLPMMRKMAKKDGSTWTPKPLRLAHPSAVFGAAPGDDDDFGILPDNWARSVKDNEEKVVKMCGLIASMAGDRRLRDLGISRLQADPRALGHLRDVIEQLFNRHREAAERYKQTELLYKTALSQGLPDFARPPTKAEEEQAVKLAQAQNSSVAGGPGFKSSKMALMSSSKSSSSIFSNGGSGKKHAVLPTPPLSKAQKQQVAAKAILAAYPRLGSGELAQLDARQRRVYFLGLRARHLKLREADGAHRLDVARKVMVELSRAVWTLTSDFVVEHIKNMNQLELEGPGDPSGKGSGFSFIKYVPAVRQTKDRTHGKFLNVKGNPEVDLRRLTAEEREKILRKQGMPIDKIKTLHRWDQTAAIGNLASAGKGGPDIVARYARSDAGTQRQQFHKYQERCRDIWDRQKAELTRDWPVAVVTTRVAVAARKEGGFGKKVISQLKKSDCDDDEEDDADKKIDGGGDDDDDDDDDVDIDIEAAVEQSKSGGSGGDGGGGKGGYSASDDRAELELMLKRGSAGSSSSSFLSPSLSSLGSGGAVPQSIPRPARMIRRVVRCVWTTPETTLRVYDEYFFCNF